MSSALTLYEVEDNYLALLETEAMVPPEQEEQFQSELRTALLEAIDKREAVLQFMLFLAEQQTAADTEIKRLQNRRDRLATVERRMNKYIVNVIRSAGTDLKGRYRKLQAHTGMMFIRALASSVDVIDDNKVPAEYKRISLSMPLDLWQRLIDKHPELEMPDVLGLRIGGITVDREKAKKQMEQGVAIDGADLRLPGHDHTLIVK
jgi:hypothetical protein